jgi:hypothetical protein
LVLVDQVSTLEDTYEAFSGIGTGHDKLVDGGLVKNIFL